MSTLEHSRTFWQLHDYCVNGATEGQIEEMIEERDFDVLSRDGDGYTFLHWSIRYPSLVYVLINKGVRVDDTENPYYRTPLMMAVKKGASLDILKALISCGADVTKRCSAGCTFLSYLCPECIDVQPGYAQFCYDAYDRAILAKHTPTPSGSSQESLAA